MALLTFSSRLPPPNILPAIVSLKSKLPRGNASQLGSPAKSSFASLSFLYFLGQSTTQWSISKCYAGAAWQPPKYVYPDPNPEFARKETQKFQVELMQRLSKNKDTFGNDIDEVVSVCTEIFSNFLHKEYGGPGTLLIEPFTDMLLALKEKKLPGAPIAARAALLWAQNYVDRDWESWSS